MIPRVTFRSSPRSSSIRSRFLKSAGIASTATVSAVALTVGLLGAVGAGAADAAPICAGAGQPTRLVGSVPGAALEGLTVDTRGRLYTTDILTGRVFRLDAPGARPVPIATVPGGGGALAWADPNTLLVGFGANPTVLVGDVARQAGIVRLDINSLASRVWVRGLSAANGMDVARNGIVYATNDFGSLVGRVYPNGAVQADWGSIPSANGAVLGRGDGFLYVSRTFVNPGVSRISTSNPRVVQSLLSTGPQTTPDGLTLDSRDRPVVPFNASGEIVRINAPGSYCTLGRTPGLASVLSYGQGTRGFSAGRLFRAGFDGGIYEVPGGFDPAARTATP